MRRILLVATAVMACSAGTDPDPNPVLSVGGTYQTAVTLVSSGCAGQTVEQHPTTVSHQSGATTLTLGHAGGSYQGTVGRDGRFTAAATQIIGGVTYQVAITGQFALTAMDATVRVDAARQPPCTFTARWAGPKSGPPNVIP
jgi:hypothetical protein